MAWTSIAPVGSQTAAVWGVAVGVDPDDELDFWPPSMPMRRPPASAWQAITQTTQPKTHSWQVSDRRYPSEGSMALLTATAKGGDASPTCHAGIASTLTPTAPIPTPSRADVTSAPPRADPARP